jgi:hypothetical protein
MPLFTAYEHNLVHSGDRATVISVGALIMDLIAAGVDLLIGKASDLSLFAACICSAVFNSGRICILDAGSQQYFNAENKESSIIRIKMNTCTESLC